MQSPINIDQTALVYDSSLGPFSFNNYKLMLNKKVKNIYKKKNNKMISQMNYKNKIQNCNKNLKIINRKT